METIFINNKIQLIENSTTFEVKVICPKRNIQKMIVATKGRFISKKELRLNFNHNAGQIFEVIIKVRFEDVKQFLKKEDIYNFRNADNFDSYIEMIKINSFGFGFAMQTKMCFKNVITSLYAFGDCSRLSGNGNTYTRYYRADGHSILRCNTDFTNNGEKRYIRTGKGLLSNRKY